MLGRNRAGTLKLWEDERGLAYDITAPATQTVEDLVLGPLRRGDVSQSSFGFEIIKRRTEDNLEEKWSLQTLTEVKLWDVSPVTFPASPTTDSGVRAALAESGIEAEALAAVVLRARAGAHLTFDELELLERSICVLRGFCEPDSPHSAESEPVAEVHLQPVAAIELRSFAARRRQLDLWQLAALTPKREETE